MALNLRRAERRELAQVEKLLKEAELPPLAPHPILANVLVAELEGRIVGTAVLEVIARSGVVRAVAVAADQRRRGTGRELYRSLLSRAQEASLKQLYVQAASGREFFEALGFEPADREEVPLAIREQARARPDAPLLEQRLR